MPLAILFLGGEHGKEPSGSLPFDPGDGHLQFSTPFM